MEKITRDAKQAAETVLQREFMTPFVGLADDDPIRLLRLSNGFVLLRLSEKLIVESDVTRAEAGHALESVPKKTLFLGYLGKVYQSALLLIGATDYLGAMVILRSVFELLVGIATETTGSMRDRIYSIEYMDDTEKACMQKLWNDLSAWAHPYRKWEKHICPKLYGTGRHHHPSLFDECIGFSDRILDLLLTITIEGFKLESKKYTDSYQTISPGAEVLAISNLDMVKKRIQ